MRKCEGPYRHTGDIYTTFIESLDILYINWRWQRMHTKAPVCRLHVISEAMHFAHMGIFSSIENSMHIYWHKHLCLWHTKKRKSRSIGKILSIALLFQILLHSLLAKVLSILKTFLRTSCCLLHMSIVTHRGTPWHSFHNGIKK